MDLWTYIIVNQSDLMTEVVQHVALVFQSVAIATILAVGIALATYRSSLTEKIAVNTAGVLFTIPSLAMFGLLIPILGLGAGPALVALVIYATLPILRNTYAGLYSVDSAVLDAARGIGMSRTSVLVKVRLPLAGPVILVGVRVATQMGMGIATIAAYAGGPGLGKEIFSGLARFGAVNSLNAVAAGMLGVVLLALAADAVFVAVERYLKPRSLHV
ncbi:MAG: ABC transporter permease [Candidatus Saccharibacteria bacterium]|nr:ABC transporter permease [Microbacteriaceae bacterium]